MNALRAKRKTKGEHYRRAQPQRGNRNAKKSQWKLELGWLNREGPLSIMKQVRSQNGGGTRHIKVDLDISVNNKFGKRPFLSKWNFKERKCR